MRKIIDTSDPVFDYNDADTIKHILNVQRLPRFIIIETIEEAE